MLRKKLIQIIFIYSFLLGGAYPAFAAKDYNIKNDTDSFFFIDGTNGNVGIGSTSPEALLQVGVAPFIPAGSLPAEAVKGNLVVDGRIYGDGSQLTGINLISGLTDNYIPRADGSDKIQDSIMYDNGTNIGIGTTQPLYKIDVVYSGGNVGIGGNVSTVFIDSNNGGVSNAALKVIYNGGAADLGEASLLAHRNNAWSTLYINGSGTALNNAIYVEGNKPVIFNGGNVGIGSVTPASRLDVYGGAARIWTGVGTVDYAVGAGSLYVEQDLEVDGNVYLGDATTDNLTVTGILSLTGGANYYSPVTISTTDAGALIVRQQGGGTQIFNVNTVTGNVGVGSAVPGAALDVVGDIRASQIIDSGLTEGRITYAGTAGRLTDNAALIFDGTNVGIGSATPSTRLAVDGTLYASGAVTLGSTLGAAGNLDVNGAANDIAGTLNLSGNALTSSGTLTVTPASGSGLNIALATTGDLAVNTSQFYVDTSEGNVGIGSSAPTSRLDVTGGAARVLIGNAAPNVGYATTAGSLYVQDNLEVDGNVYLGDATTDNLTVTGTLSLTGGANYYSPVTISTTDAGALVVRQEGSGTQIFNVNTVTGNVGVGSAVPGTTLDVVGDIRASQIIDSGLTEGRITYAGTAGRLTDNAALIFDGTNVGIGSATPSTRLAVDGTLYASGAVTLGSTLDVEGDLAVNADQFYVNTSTGNVGIGTALPLAMLSVGAGAPDAMPPTGSDLYVKGNIEVDGKIYADGFALTNIPAGGLDKEVQFNDAGLMAGATDFTYDKTAGNVGIGTTYGFVKLAVVGSGLFSSWETVPFGAEGSVGLQIGNAAAVPTILAFDYLNVQPLNLEIRGKDTIFYNDSSLNVLPGGASIERMRISTAGNVGIGSAVPGQKLDVVGNVRASQVIDSGLTEGRITYAGTAGQLRDNANLVFDGTNVGIGTSIPTHLLEVAGDISVTGSSDSYFMSNVGVGTSVPVYKLDVAGTLNATGATTLGSTLTVTGTLDVNGGGTNDIAGTLNLSGGALTSSGALTITPAATNNLNVVLSGTGDLAVNTSQLYVDTSAGNVGIGTAAPRAKLDVGGPIFIEQAAAPSPATDRLYNTAGNLFWSGSQLAIGAALTWNVVSGTSQAMSVNNGYVANNAALVTITLPATAAAGTVVAVTGGLGGVGGWKIAQNAGQTIHFGSVDTTTGVTGYLSSNNQFDGVQLVCVNANTDFVVIASQGNITYF